MKAETVKLKGERNTTTITRRGEYLYVHSDDHYTGGLVGRIYCVADPIRARPLAHLLMDDMAAAETLEAICRPGDDARIIRAGRRVA